MYGDGGERRTARPRLESVCRASHTQLKQSIRHFRRSVFPAKQLAQSVLTQMLAALSPFLILPVLARASDEGEWSAFVLGQTLGLLVSVLASFSWPLSGISDAAKGDHESRKELFALSLTTRLSALCLFAPLAALFAVSTSPSTHSLVTISTLIGVAFSSGLAFNWYFVAVGSPYKSLIYTVTPSLIATAVTAILVLDDASPAVYGIALLLSSMVFFYAAAVREGGVDTQRIRRASSVKLITGYIRSHLSASTSQVVAAVNVALPMILATAMLTGPSADLFATANRVMVIASSVLLSIGSVFQAWSSPGPKRRAVTSAFFTVGLGAVGLLILASFGAELIQLVFGTEMSLEQSSASLIAAYVLARSVRLSMLRFVMVSRSQYRSTLLANALGLLVLAVGIPLLIGSVESGTVNQILFAILAAEAAIILVQLGAIAISSHALRFRKNAPSNA